MNEEKKLAESYRTRAEELRVIAEMDSARTTKQTLMNIAEDYERMAATLEAIAVTNGRLERSAARSAQLEVEEGIGRCGEGEGGWR